LVSPKNVEGHLPNLLFVLYVVVGNTQTRLHFAPSAYTIQILVPPSPAVSFFTTFLCFLHGHPLNFQVPPAIPILLVAHIVSWLRWSRLVIDWHNYGHTILAVTKKKHFSVTLYRWFEKIFGRGAHAYFCVSKAMREDLRDNWGIR
jgi:beta-1,4-mannosyltransferase